MQKIKFRSNGTYYVDYVNLINENELKVCPFCKNKPEIFYNDFYYEIECKHCDYSIKNTDKIFLVKKWNNR